MSATVRRLVTFEGAASVRVHEAGLKFFQVVDGAL